MFDSLTAIIEQKRYLYVVKQSNAKIHISVTASYFVYKNFIRSNNCNFRLRPNSITLSSSLAGRGPVRDLPRDLVRQLVCDLLWLNSITLSMSQTWSQTWFPTCCRQVQTIFHYAILLCYQLVSWSQVGQRNVIWSRTGLLPASKLDSVMEFGLRYAHDVQTQVFVQLARSSRTSSRAGHRPARELVASWIV